jgi:WD40 repeat protein
VRYDAFISYNHGADGGIAPYLQEALQRIAMPWYRRRGMAVFRDYTDLPADADLAEAIASGLDESRYYVLIASPGSRDSKWVGQEIDHWLATKSAARKRVVLVLTQGEIDLDDAKQIDYDRSTALHEQMRGRFAQAPLYIDLTTARQKIDDGTLSHRQFRREYRHDVALVAAKIKEVTVREVIDEDAKFQHRKLLLAWSAAAMLLLLSVAAIVGFVSARNNAAEARAQARNARSLGLASQSSSATGQDAPQALALALASRGQATTEIGHRALQTAVASPIWRVFGPAVRTSFADPAPTTMSPRGHLVAAGNAGDGVTVWDSAFGTRHKTLHAPGTIEARDLAFSPDETRLAATFLTPPAKRAGDPRGRLVIWDLSMLEAVVKIDTPTVVLGVAYGPKGGAVAAGDIAGNVRLWDADGGNPRVVATGFPVVTTVSFSPDGRFVAATTAGIDRATPGAGNVVIIDVQEGVPVASIAVGSSQALSGAYSADGKTFFTGDVDGNVRAWDLATGSPITSWTDSGPVESVAVSPRAPLVVSGDLNGEVTVRDSRTGVERSTWSEGTLVTSVGVSADGGRLATGNDRGRVTIRKTARLPNVYSSGDSVRSLAFAAGSSQIVSYSEPGTTGDQSGGDARILHLDANTSEPLLAGTRPSRIALNSAGTLAALVETNPAAGDGHEKVTVLDLATKGIVTSWDLNGAVVDADFVSDDAILAVVEHDGKDRLRGWDAMTGQPEMSASIPHLKRVDSRQAVGSSVALTGSTLAFADADVGVVAMDLDTKKQYQLPENGATTDGFVMSRDGNEIAAFVDTEGFGAPTEVHVWDLRANTVRPVTTNTSGGTPTTAVFTGDGTKLAVGDDKARVTLYDLRDYHVITEWDVSSAVTALAFSPDGQTLAAADDLGQIEAWDSSSWQSSDANLVAQLCRKIAGYQPIPRDWTDVDPYSKYADLCRSAR